MDIRGVKANLKEVRKTLNEIIINTSDISLIVNFNGDILTANKEFLKITCHTDETIKKYTLFQFIDPCCHVQLKKKLMQLQTGEDSASMECRITGKSGFILYIEIRLQILKQYKPPAVLVQINNISSLKKLEKQFLDYTVQIEEKERHRFAEALHDDLGPYLSGIKLYIDELGKTNVSNAQKKRIIKYVKTMIDEAIRKTRKISNFYMPDVLMDYGLKTALTLFIDKLRIVDRPKIELNIVNFDKRINKTIEVIIYRILIELINNSIKHAEANRIFIKLLKDNYFITAKYKDDGKGFNIEKAINSLQGIGLNSIIMRLNSLHATYNYSSKINGGMSFDFEINYSDWN